tara:strand:- start:2075 stop:2530 length:456 start_codon:yes stop_codon:yes gene_type:complete
METNLAFLCFDITRLFRKRFAEAARSIGGTGAQWRSLLILERRPGINQGALAEHLDVEPITACRMIDRLEQAGLVERRRDPDDRRVWQLFLTKDAEPFVAELNEIGHRALAQATANLNDEEIAGLVAGLEKVRDGIASLDECRKPAEADNG